MKKIIRKLANKLGYDFIKLRNSNDKKAHIKHNVIVGNYTITMPGNNPQISNYKYYPQLNEKLGTLAKFINEKYPIITVLDVGANVGDTLAIIKSKVDIPIIAIEGDDISYNYLEENAKKFENIFLVKSFLGETQYTIGVSMEKKGWNNTIIPNEKSHIQISFDTLDNIIEKNNLQKNNLKLLKVDTEGFDTIILRGSSRIIETHKPVIYFEYNKSNMEAINEDGLATLINFKKYGYDSICFFDGLGRFIIKLDINQIENITQLHNYIDENNSRIGYYDICLFHSNDKDLEDKFIKLN